MEIKNVAVYCRVSTQEQKKFGVSIDEQKDSITKYCKEHKYHIYDYYIDDGVSGGSIKKRKEIQRLLKDLDHFDLILFTKLDRFSRNVKDANDMLVELEKHNVSFRAINDSMIDTSTADGRFTFNLLVNLAERERGIDSERIKKANDYKYRVAKTICSGTKIFGYDVVDKKYVVNEKEQQILIEMFNYYAKCNSIRQTLRWYRENYGSISIDAIKGRLSNKKYIGEYQRFKSDEIVEDYIPALINKELFDKVQRLLSMNIKNSTSKQKQKPVYYFSQLVRCGCCGNKMSGKLSGYSCKHNDKFYKNYICHTAANRQDCENKRSLSEIIILNELTQNYLKYVNRQVKAIEKVKKVKVVDKTPNIKEKMNKLTDLYLNDLITREKYAKEYNKLKEELDNQKVIVQEPKVPIIKKDYSKLLNNDAMELYNKLNEEGKQRFWRKIIKEIVIKDGQITSVIFY